MSEDTSATSTQVVHDYRLLATERGRKDRFYLLAESGVPHAIGSVSLTPGRGTFTIVKESIPFAIDPRYARYTLALGRESLWAIIDCSRSTHTFLARNAVAILGALDYPEALERLREIVRADKDPIAWVHDRGAIGGRRGGSAEDLAMEREENLDPFGIERSATRFNGA